MQPKPSPRGTFQSIFDVTAIIGILGVFGFFAWHSAAYMDLIFEESGGDPRDLRNLAAGAVQVVALGAVVVVVFMIRGGGQKPIDDLKQEEDEESGG